MQGNPSLRTASASGRSTPSRGAKLTFLAACLTTTAIIAGVHYIQGRDAENRRIGIERDLEKRKKWRANDLDHRLQQQLKEEYSKEQQILPVRSAE